MSSENEFLEQKINSLQSDLKAVLTNRKKLENIEDIILGFSKDGSQGGGNDYEDNQQQQIDNFNSQQQYQQNNTNKNFYVNNTTGNQNLKDKSYNLGQSVGGLINPFSKTLLSNNSGQHQQNYDSLNKKALQSQSFPENFGNFNDNLNNNQSIEKLPQWYINLKMKKG